MWGASKDWGLSGLRLGVLHTANPQLRAAFVCVGYAYACPAGAIIRLSASVKCHSQKRLHGIHPNVSQPTVVQNLFAAILEDSAFVDNYLAEQQHRLTARYAAVRTRNVKLVATQTQTKRMLPF